MKEDLKWKITFNLLTIIPALVRGIPEAFASYERHMAMLSDGISDEEWGESGAAFLAESDELLAKVEAAKAKLAVG